MKKKRKYATLSYTLIYSKLMLYFFSFYDFLFFRLLTDAEILKNIPQYFICSNFTAYNFGQMEKAFT